MLILRLLLYIFCILLNDLSIVAVPNHYTEHKNPQLQVYLNMISANLEEKTEIVEHIKKHPAGTYLDIGTGGDGIATIIKKIDTQAPTTLIAADIDKNILNNIQPRHPEIGSYLGQKRTGLHIVFQELDATNLSLYQNNTISGINASALCHELVSYAGGSEALERFLKEAMRVLTNDGVLVYRDPESPQNIYESVTAQILALPLKQFANIFLPKFLDTTFTQISHKFNLYNKQSVHFECWQRNASQAQVFTYDDYVRLPTKTIDFEKPYRITLPRGLCQELERHYIMFLHEYASLLFVTAHYDVISGTYRPSFRALRSRDAFINYCLKLGVPVHDGAITIDMLQALQVYQASLLSYLNTGIQLFNAQDCLSSLQARFQKHNLLFANYVTITKTANIEVDYKIAALLWSHIKNFFINHDHCSITHNNKDLLEWLQREGEETYFYASPDELIVFVGEKTLTHMPDNNYCLLAPLSPAHNKSIIREGYNTFLMENIYVTNQQGVPLKQEERKRIIHFAKMPIEKAIEVYTQLIQNDPQGTTNVARFMKALKKRQSNE